MKPFSFVIGIMLLLLIYSCNDTSKRGIMPTSSSSKTQIQDLTALDTFKLKMHGKLFDEILIYLIERTPVSEYDSIGYYKIDFILGEELRHTITTKIHGDWDGREWFFDEEVMANQETRAVDPRFLCLYNGYPENGNVHDCFLFYVNEGRLDLVDQWQSMFEHGSEKQREFFPKYSGNHIISFSAHDYEVFRKNPTDAVEILGIEYNDSVRFDFKSGIWKKIYITPKDKVYRTREILYNEYYNF